MKKHLFLITLHLAAVAADSYYTDRTMRLRGSSERDPIARPFVSHGTALLAGFFACEAGLTLTFDAYLRKHRHERAADALLIGQTIDNTIGTVYTVRHYHEVK